MIIGIGYVVAVAWNGAPEGVHALAAALPFLEKAVQIQPKLTQNQVNLAACLIEMKDFVRAQRTLEDVIAGHPRFPGQHPTSRPARSRPSQIASVTSGIANLWPRSLASSAVENLQTPIICALRNRGHSDER